MFLLREFMKEALEEMGVMPKIDSYAVTEEETKLSSDVEIPEFVPDINSIIKEQENNQEKKKDGTFFRFFRINYYCQYFRRHGEILCSLGIVNMKEICVEGKLKLSGLKGHHGMVYMK